MQFLWNFLKDEEGLELVEYAVMLALIVAGLFVLITALGDAVGSKFSEVTSVIES